MRFEYQPSLVEQAVFLAVRRDPRLECDLHRELDPLYSIPDGETRDCDFRRVYADSFKRLDLDRPIPKLVSERPTITNAVALCVVHEAESARAQSAELFVKGQTGTNDARTCTLVIRVCAESLLDADRLDSWMRRELLLVADMLDEKFGYEPDEVQGLPWERKLRQDRYMVLWRIYIAGRLNRAGFAEDQEVFALRKAFGRAFMNQGAPPPPAAFDDLLNAEALTHAQLLAWAIAPQTFFLGQSTSAASTQRPGGMCPLCGFPTHDWFDFRDEVSVDLAASIENTHRSWNRSQGACRRCMETYACRFECCGGRH